MKCKKCNCMIYGLGDDYFCPICNDIFCYECIENHSCNVETYSIGNKNNYVKIL